MRVLMTMAMISLAAFPVAAQQPAPVAVTVDPAVTYQTWEGWGGMLPMEIGTPFNEWVKNPTAEVYDQNLPKTGPPDAFRAKLLDMCILDMRLNRFRLEVGPQVEIENDNDDPNVTDESKYRWAWQDACVENWYLPVCERLKKLGVKPVLYISYDLASGLTKPFLKQPAEYAEMAETFLRHLKTKYGIEPDYWSVINEPANKRRIGSPTLCAELTAAVGARIAKAGYRTKMSGAENVAPQQVDTYMKEMEKVPGALDHFKQITFHLYGVRDDLRLRKIIHDWSKKWNVTSAQTEWLFQEDLPVIDEVWKDLTITGVVAWERYQWGSWVKLGRNKKLEKGSNGSYLWQFTHHIRPGYVRLDAKSADDAIRVVAFMSPAKKAVLILINKDKNPRTVAVSGLPAGSYAATHTSKPKNELCKPLSDQAAVVGATLTLELAPESVTTLSAVKD